MGSVLKLVYSTKKIISELENIYDSDEEEGNTSENVGASETGARSKEGKIDAEKEKSKTAGATSISAEDEEKDRKDSAFECNICLDVASDAVISMCGHLFCWPCLHQWLETRFVKSHDVFANLFFSNVFLINLLYTMDLSSTKAHFYIDICIIRLH